jgi:hemerythrin-like metal-binding protein
MLDSAMPAMTPPIPVARQTISAADLLAEIDREHDVILDAIGVFETARADELVAAWERIIIYAREHFEHEEQHMAVLATEVREAHIANHQRIASILEDLTAEIGHPLTKVDRLVRVLRDWLETHIDRHDRLLVEALR